jgi:hypothetical protein
MEPKQSPRVFPHNLLRTPCFWDDVKLKYLKWLVSPEKMDEYCKALTGVTAEVSEPEGEIRFRGKGPDSFDKRQEVRAHVHTHVWNMLEPRLTGLGTSTVKRIIRKALWEMDWRAVAEYGTLEAEALRNLNRKIVEIENTVAEKLKLPSEAVAYLKSEGIQVMEDDVRSSEEHHLSCDVRGAREGPLQGQGLEDLKKGIDALLANNGDDLADAQYKTMEVNTGGETGYSFIVPLKDGSYIVLESWPEQNGTMKIIGSVRGESMARKCRALMTGLINLIKNDDPHKEKTQVCIEGMDTEGTYVPPGDVVSDQELIKSSTVGGLRVEGRTTNATKLTSPQDAAKCAEAIAVILEKERLNVETDSSRNYPPGPCIVHNIKDGYSIFVPLTDSFVIVRVFPGGCVDILVDLCHFSRENSSRTCNVFAEIAALFGGAFSVHEGPHIP